MAGSKSRIGASTDAATDGVTRVEIVTRGEPRREYTSAQRAEILTEAALPGARVLTVAQRHGISPSLVLSMLLEISSEVLDGNSPSGGVAMRLFEARLGVAWASCCVAGLIGTAA